MITDLKRMAELEGVDESDLQLPEAPEAVAEPVVAKRKKPAVMSARDQRLAREAEAMARYRARIALHPNPADAKPGIRSYGSGAGLCFTIPHGSRRT